MSLPWSIPDYVAITVMLASIGLVAYLTYGLFVM
jgi:hypothetical protein